MNKVIDSIVESIANVRALDISDDEKLAHIKGILKFAEILLEENKS